MICIKTLYSIIRLIGPIQMLRKDWNLKNLKGAHHYLYRSFLRYSMNVAYPQSQLEKSFW